MLHSTRLDRIIEQGGPPEPLPKWESAFNWVKGKTWGRGHEIALSLRYKPGRILVGYMPITGAMLRSYMTVKQFGRPLKVMRDAPITDAILHRDDWNEAPLLVHFRSRADKERTLVYYFNLGEELEVAVYAKPPRDEKEW